MNELRVRKLDEDSFVLFVDKMLIGTFHKSDYKDLLFNINANIKKLDAPQILTIKEKI